MVCHGEHTYLYSQLLMQILSQEPRGGPNIRRLFQEVQQCAKQRYGGIFNLVAHGCIEHVHTNYYSGLQILHLTTQTCLSLAPTSDSADLN